MPPYSAVFWLGLLRSSFVKFLRRGRAGHFALLSNAPLPACYPSNSCSSGPVIPCHDFEFPMCVHKTKKIKYIYCISCAILSSKDGRHCELSTCHQCVYLTSGSPDHCIANHRHELCTCHLDTNTTAHSPAQRSASRLHGMCICCFHTNTPSCSLA